jgi:tRNA 2-(methylsulfanyl)-N6-isopentenyladenosine37 hydroxylase
VLCLTQPTDARWVSVALSDLPSVLVDHAHCEMKAATTALALATRADAFPEVVRALVMLAEEELAHFRAVLDELERREVPLGRPPVDAYAAELLRAVLATARDRSPAGALSDRLLVGALIEARSCERFKLLSLALDERGDALLVRFYEELFTAEARHYRQYVDLAGQVLGDEARARTRLAAIAGVEAEVAARFGTRPAIHG